MSEINVFQRAAMQVAGVSLHRPELWYMEKQPWGTAVLLRASQDPRLEHATLRLELDPETAGPYALKGSPTAVDKVRFAMKDWLAARAPANPFNDLEKQAGPAAWRSLLVEQGLLAHPELVFAGAVMPEAPVIPAAKRMDEACAQALERLRRRFENLVAMGAPTPVAYPLRCEGCREFDEEGLHSTARLLGGLRPLPQPRWVWERIATPKPDCVHVPMATSALQALCKTYPELIFELLRLLVPEGALPEGRPGQPPRRESRRFVLEPAALELLLGNWLLDERHPGDRRGSGRGHGEHGRPRRERRNYHLSAAARQAQAGSALPAGLRAGVSFSAVAWGIQLPIEQLAWMPVTPATDRGSAPARQPVFDFKASDLLDVPRFLPDVATLQEPRPEPGTPRRRVPKREAVSARTREVGRRAK